MSREDIVRLGQAGRAWEFLPVAFQALKVAPGDAGLRVLCAANLAQTGLVTVAREQMEMLPAEVAGDAALAGLWKMLAERPHDRMEPGQAREWGRRNAVRLEDRGVVLGAEVEKWEAGLGGWEWFRSADGNVVRRRGELWLGLADHFGFADQFAREKLTPVDPKASLFVLEGVDPPWMLIQMAQATARQKDGFQARLVVVQEDPQELLWGLAHADMPLLEEERVSVFAGPGAGMKLGAWLAKRTEFKLNGPLVGLSAVRKRTEPGIAAVVRASEDAQGAEHSRLEKEVAEVYAGRDAGWWKRRYDAVMSDVGCGMSDVKTGDRPIPHPTSDVRHRLRVLVPTSRFSTFLKHASADLVAALRAAGCEARLMMEPVDSTRSSSIAYLRALREFQPDLVVLVNHMRVSLGEWFPREVPFVTWIQDAMPHQFDGTLGAKQTEMDFLVGHLHEEMFTKFGFPRGRSAPMPVVASEAKFHGGACAPELLARHECEMALVSHHGETPRRMHERQLGELGRGSAGARAIDALYGRIEALITQMQSGEMKPLQQSIAEMVEEEVGKHVGSGDRALTLMLRTYAMPMADRMLRHQSVAWATEIAGRRGWRFHLYGRGWAEVPEFAEFARGELEHGEELRASYRAAGVHLHISAHTLCHQRVMECALSGGLPVCRLTPEAADLVRIAVRRRLWLKGERPRSMDAEGRGTFVVADHAELMGYASLLQRLGMQAGAAFDAGRGGLPADLESLRRSGETEIAMRPDWLLGDMAAVTFRTEEGLAALVERAVEGEEWRGAMSKMIAGRVRERLTHGALVKRILGVVRAGLGGGAEGRQAGRLPHTENARAEVGPVSR